MAKRIDEVVVDALELPPSDRAALAELLLRSLEEEGDPEPVLSPAWREEIRRRIREVDEGKAVLIPAEEAIARARAALRDR